MNGSKNKGFTIVELVIVIAIIAILAAVLIPTYATVTEKAHRSNALSKAKTSFTLVAVEEDGIVDQADYYFVMEHYIFKYSRTDGVVEAVSERLENVAAAWSELETITDNKVPVGYFCNADVDETLTNHQTVFEKDSSGEFSSEIVTNIDISKDIIIVKYALSAS